MTRSSNFSNSLGKDPAVPRSCDNATAESRDSGKRSATALTGSTPNDALCCEARNCLQVILSGAEILLEDHLGNLLGGQKELLIKMAENTHHLCHLLAKLLGPEEFKMTGGSTERVPELRRAPAKV
jgi:hypothetical protein